MFSSRSFAILRCRSLPIFMCSLCSIRRVRLVWYEVPEWKQHVCMSKWEGMEAPGYEEMDREWRGLTHVIIIRSINAGLKGFRGLVVLLSGRYEETLGEVVVRIRGVLVRLHSSRHERLQCVNSGLVCGLNIQHSMANPWGPSNIFRQVLSDWRKDERKRYTAQGAVAARLCASDARRVP